MNKLLPLLVACAFTSAIANQSCDPKKGGFFNQHCEDSKQQVTCDPNKDGFFNANCEKTAPAQPATPPPRQMRAPLRGLRATPTRPQNSGLLNHIQEKRNDENNRQDQNDNPWNWMQ